MEFKRPLVRFQSLGPKKSPVTVALGISLHIRRGAFAQGWRGLQYG